MSIINNPPEMVKREYEPIALGVESTAMTPSGMNTTTALFRQPQGVGMNPVENLIAMLVLNRDFGETIQRITSAQEAASPEFQAWLRYKNANRSDIYIGMNPPKPDAATRTREEIESDSAPIHRSRLRR